MTRLQIGIAALLVLGVLVLALTGLHPFGKAHESTSRTSRPEKAATEPDHPTADPPGREEVAAVPLTNRGTAHPQRLVEELRAALREGNVVEARLVAEQLARTSGATAPLMGLIRDQTVAVPGWLLALLRKSVAEDARTSLAQASWDRLQSAFARGGGDRSPRELYEMVVDHGAQDLFVALMEHVKRRRIGNRITDALAVSPRPLATGRFAELFVAGHAHEKSARLFAQHHPARAADLYRETLLRMSRGERGPGRYRLKDLARLYAKAVPAEQLPDVRGVLDALHGQPDFAAVYLVNRLHERDIDVSGYGDQLEAPVIELERIASGNVPADQISKRAYAALYAIEYNPVAWSGRAANALESAGRAIASTHASLGQNLSDNAARIRGALRMRK